MKNKDLQKNLFIENLHKDYKLMLSKSSVIYSGKTKYQTVEIFENKSLGRVLVLDGIVQLTEADESNYHEMIAHITSF